MIIPCSYTFCEYSPEWPEEFAREAERLRQLLGDEMVVVHHFGSTSVPGLAAKAIIDMLPLVRDIRVIDDYTKKLEEAGYHAWGEYGLSGRRFFTRDDGEQRTHNIHFYQWDNPEVARHLAFCAYLRSHPQERAEYEALKRAVYARHPADIQAYNNGKNDWIKHLEPIALDWYRSQSGSK
jgi:GrpB-like predicted nucleotidyltransferase (UPF0157 family)